MEGLSLDKMDSEDLARRPALYPSWSLEEKNLDEPQNPNRKN